MEEKEICCSDCTCDCGCKETGVCTCENCDCTCDCCKKSDETEVKEAA